jgi:peptide/nickel transport system permease protein
MVTYIIRRLILAVPALIFISFIIFMIVKLSPSDPTANLPLTIPPEVREQIRESLGVNEPLVGQYLRWARMMFITEPLIMLEDALCSEPAGPSRHARRLLADRAARHQPHHQLPDPQPRLRPDRGLTAADALGRGLVLHHRHPDRHAARHHLGLQAVFGDRPGRDLLLDGRLLHPDLLHRDDGDHHLLGLDPDDAWWWLPIELRHHARDRRLGQLRLPASADGHADDGAGLYNAAQISRYMRASMLDNLQQDYVRTARAKGMGEGVVVLRHVLRNSLIPVVTVIALNVPAVFGGALITEQVFRVNGIGYQLISAIRGADVPHGADHQLHLRGACRAVQPDRGCPLRHP